METSSPPRDGASHRLDPSLGTWADARERAGTGFAAFGCSRAGRRPPRARPRACPRPRNPASQPRGPRAPRTYTRPPRRALPQCRCRTPPPSCPGCPWFVPVSRRPAWPASSSTRPRPRPAAPPKPEVPRPAAAPRGRCRGQKKNGDWQLRKPIRAARRGHGRALSPRSASGAAQSWWGGGSDQGVSGPRARPAGCTGGRQAGEGRRVCGGAAVEKGGAAS